MNNSKFAIDNTLEDKPQQDIKPILRQRESELVKVIEAMRRVSENEDWQYLKKTLFDKSVETLEQMILHEAKGEVRNNELYRLQGRLMEAKRHDFENLAQAFKVELEKTRKTLEQNAKND